MNIISIVEILEHLTGSGHQYALLGEKTQIFIIHIGGKGINTIHHSYLAKRVTKSLGHKKVFFYLSVVIKLPKFVILGQIDVAKHLVTWLVSA